MKAHGRYKFIRATTILGAAIVVTTEVLSLAHALTRSAVIALWVAAILIAAWYSRGIRFRSIRARIASLERHDWIYLSIVGGISAVNLVLALIAAPSAWDALSYHVPRISHWIQNQSVAHYPTHIDRQLWIPPAFEFFALHLELLTGTDRFMNCVQWLSSIGCAIVASQIAAQLGAARRGQLFAAAFAITLPMEIAQASGSQADLFASFWIAASVSLVLRGLLDPLAIDIRSSVILGACLGLAALAKGTAYLFLFPFVVWLMVSTLRSRKTKALGPILFATVTALAVNGGHYARNYSVFGNPLTNPKAPSLVNESLTPGILASNVVRNVTAHTHSRFASLNEIQQSAVATLHRTLGVNPSDPRSTYFTSRYTIVARARTEGWVGNPFHLALMILCAVAMIFRRRTATLQMKFLLAVLAGFILFCAVLKWQPWNSRLHLPVFVLAAGLVGAVLERMIASRLVTAIAIALALTSTSVLLRNPMRPVASSEPIWSLSREQRYFIETRGIYESHVAAAEFLASRPCSNVGLITSWVDWEELLWVVMRNRSPTPVRISHVGIDSRRGRGKYRHLCNRGSIPIRFSQAA